MAVAVAGKSDSISENVARDKRAIANWSQTYGITDELTPTPTAAAKRSPPPETSGWMRERYAGGANTKRQRGDHCNEHGNAQAINSAHCAAAARDARLGVIGPLPLLGHAGARFDSLRAGGPASRERASRFPGLGAS